MSEQYNSNYTFQELVDIVKAYIKTNSVNITNFAGINATLKAGYNNTIRLGGQYTTSAVNYYYTRYSIVANAATQATVDQVDNDMNVYLASINRTSLSEIVPETEVLQFIEELMVFCYNHCWFLNGQFATGNIFIYSPGTRTDVEPLPRTYFDLIRASDMLQLINNFTTNIKAVCRYVTAKYRYEWSWTPISESAGTTSNVWYII